MAVNPLVNLFPLDYMQFKEFWIVWKKGPGEKVSTNQTNEIQSLLVSLNGRKPS